MYCPQCGNQTQDTAKFCSTCGQSLQSIRTVPATPEKEERTPSSYTDTFRRYIDFSGRANRREYWTFVLVNLVISFCLGILEGVLELAADTQESILGGIWMLIVLLPTLSVGVRRMHDTGNPGILLVVPLLNLICLLYPGHQGANKYGPEPA